MTNLYRDQIAAMSKAELIETARALSAASQIRADDPSTNPDEAATYAVMARDARQLADILSEGE